MTIRNRHQWGKSMGNISTGEGHINRETRQTRQWETDMTDRTMGDRRVNGGQTRQSRTTR